ncbi:MAG: protein kinase [Myxococcota bacterium]
MAQVRATDELHGQVLAGKYAVVDTVGVGGSATVYRVVPQGRTEAYALKLMHTDHPDGDVERQRFAREAEMLRKLQHPNIVGLIDYGHTEDDRPFLVFPLLNGRPLKDKLKAEAPFPPSEAGRIAAEVLRALEKAHNLGVAHRDIKPENIFMSRDASGETVQLLDFGLAKVALEQDEALTRVGSVVGTPRYIAPEQARGEEVGPAADIYSLGLVLAEMVSGQPLVQGKNHVEIYVQQGSDKPHRLPPAVLDSPFASVIRRAVDKKPAVRYRLASQMLADVRSATERLSQRGPAVMPNLDVVEDDDEFEATAMLDPSAMLRLSQPTEMSEKLREAFNRAAEKNEKRKARAAARTAQPRFEGNERPTQRPGPASHRGPPPPQSKRPPPASGRGMPAIPPGPTSAAPNWSRPPTSSSAFPREPSEPATVVVQRGPEAAPSRVPVAPAGPQAPPVALASTDPPVVATTKRSPLVLVLVAAVVVGGAVFWYLRSRGFV